MRDATGRALAPLPAGYTELFGRVLRAAESDDRVRAAWLTGSVGRGVADAGSDLDVVLAISPEWFDDFTGAWREWLGRVTPVVLARELPRLPGSFSSVTPDCLRLDVVAEPAGAARPADLAGRLLVLRKDGAAPVLDPGAEPVAAGPSQARLTLPAATASQAAVLTAMRAAATAFRREAMAILAATEVPRPADFDAAVRRYWQQHELGWPE